MVKVNLVQIGPKNSYNEIIEMAAVPRVGEAIDLGDAGFDVHVVIWTIGNPQYDVQVRFR